MKRKKKEYTPPGKIVKDPSGRKTASEKLSSSDKRFKELVDNSLAGICRTSLKGEVLYVNTALCRMGGFDSPGEIMSADALSHYKDKSQRELLVKELIEKGSLNNCEVEFIKKNGDIFQGLLSAVLEGDIISGMIIDISDRKKMENELATFRFLSENSSDAHFLLGRDAKFLYANEAACKMFGYSKNELLTLRVRDVDVLYDISKYGELFNLIQKEKIPPIETTNKRKDGTLFPSEITVTGHQIDGRPYMFAALRDITERRQYEEKLRASHEDLEKLVHKRTGELEKINRELSDNYERLRLSRDALHKSEKRFRMAAEVTSDLIWEGDVRTDSLHWFGDIDGVLGYERGEFPRTVSGHNECIHPEDRDAVSDAVKKAVESGDDFHAAYRMICRDGTYRYWEERGRPIEFEKGAAVKWVGSVTDITEHVKADETVRESEKRFRLLAEVAFDGIAVTENGVFKDLNDEFAEMFGYSAAELLGKESVLLVEPGRRQDIYQKMLAGYDTMYETVGMKKNGTLFPIEVSARNIKYRGRILRIAAIKDITGRKRAEEILQQSRAKYRDLSQQFNVLLDAIPDNLILLSPDLKILWANRAFASSEGNRESNVKGKHCYRRCCRISSPCKDCPALKCFRSGREELTRIMSTQGRVFDKRAFPVKDKEGSVVNVIELSRDVTAQVHMEEEAKLVQSRMIQANKMTSLGTLVSGVAHEINNPNSYIMNNAQVFSEVWNDAVRIMDDHYLNNRDLCLAGVPFEEMRKIVPKLLFGINDGALRIKKIVDNLKDFSRPEKSRLDGKVDINRVIMTSTSILETHIKKHTNQYLLKCAESIPSPRGSTHQIEQVVINLIMNALQSLPGKKAGVFVYSSHNRKTNTVDIRVRDEGIGIQQEVLDRVMEPFFTTRHDIGGTGLGLSISYAIVKEHGGTLTIKSKEGRGTTAVIKLPLDEQ